MKDTFSEVKLFQVRPDRIDEFEQLIETIAREQAAQPGCVGVRYLKRFYVFDDVKEPPRPLTRIVKCVKYFSYWEFDAMEHYAQATRWFFEAHAKSLFRLLIMPFDINCGKSLF